MKKAFAHVGGGQILGALSQAAFVMLVLRSSGVDEFARYTLSLTAYYLAYGVSSAAFQRAYFIEYEAITLRYGRLPFLGAQLTVACIALVLVQFGSVQPPDLALLTAAMVATSLFFENIRWEYQRQERFLAYTSLGLAQNLLNLILVAAIVVTGLAVEAWILIASQVASRVLVSASVLAIDPLVRDLRAHSGPLPPIKDLVRRGYIYLAAFHGLDGLLTQLAVLLLARTAASYDVGSYGAALRYIGIAGVAVVTSRSVLLPLIGKATSADEIRGQREDYFKVSIVLSLVIAFPALMAPLWVPLVDGGRYPASVFVYQVLSVATVLNVWVAFELTVLMRHRQHKRLCLYALAGLGANLVANLTLVPLYGAVGAAIGTLIGLAVFDVLGFARGRALRDRAPA